MRLFTAVGGAVIRFELEEILKTQQTLTRNLIPHLEHVGVRVCSPEDHSVARHLASTTRYQKSKREIRYLEGFEELPPGGVELRHSIVGELQQ